MEGVREGYVEKYCRSTAVDGFSAMERGMSEVALHENGFVKEPLQIMVVDGTWRQVKAMVKELDRMIENNFPSLPPLTHVKLLPDTLR